jgi:hypothetical protein
MSAPSSLPPLLESFFRARLAEAHGGLPLHRELVQPSAAALRPRIPVADCL